MSGDSPTRSGEARRSGEQNTSTDVPADANHPVTVEGLDVAYGDLQVLWDVSLEVRADDDIISLVGPNGAGKSTLLRAISGLVPVTDGQISVFGTDTAGLEPDEIVGRGFVHVAEERHLFDGMSVAENLEMGAFANRAVLEDTRRDVYNLFPALSERADNRAGTLSGGERQMLAIGRALMAQPRVLALDEPSVGLAPQLAQRVFEEIESLSDDLTVLLVEQHVEEALSMADRTYLLENGRIVTEGDTGELLTEDRIRDAYLR